MRNDTVAGEYRKRQLFNDFGDDTARRRKVQESLQKIEEGIKGLMEDSLNDTTAKK